MPEIERHELAIQKLNLLTSSAPRINMFDKSMMHHGKIQSEERQDAGEDMSFALDETYTATNVK